MNTKLTKGQKVWAAHPRTPRMYQGAEIIKVGRTIITVRVPAHEHNGVVFEPERVFDTSRHLIDPKY
jgi:hypothetical protein